MEALKRTIPAFPRWSQNKHTNNCCSAVLNRIFQKGKYSIRMKSSQLFCEGQPDSNFGWKLMNSEVQQSIQGHFQFFEVGRQISNKNEVCPCFASGGTCIGIYVRACSLSRCAQARSERAQIPQCRLLQTEQCCCEVRWIQDDSVANNASKSTEFPIIALLMSSFLYYAQMI